MEVILNIEAPFEQSLTDPREISAARAISRVIYNIINRNI